jgi:flagellin
MGLVLTNNVSSLTAQNNLNSTNNALSKSLERLSTGLKVNRGADGPAALVISEQQRAQIAGIRSAIDNTNKAVSLVQTGEGALNEINSLLGKVRGLVLDSNNVGVNDANTLAANQAEINNALGTITNIANQTQFGSKKLLDGSAALTTTDNNANATATATGSIPAGSYSATVTSAATRANVQGGAVNNATFDGTSRQETLTVNGVNVSYVQSDADAAGSLSAAASAINNASANTGVRASIDTVTGGASQLRLYSTNYGTGNKISVSSNLAAADSVLGAVAANTDGTDISGSIGGVAASGKGNTLTSVSGAGAGLSVTFNSQAAGDTFTSATNNPFTSDATATTVTVDDSKALQFQIGANAGQTAQISLNDARASALGQGASGSVTDLSKIDVTKLATNKNLSSDLLKVVDKSISDVTSQRGQLGAFQANTLQSNANNLQTTLQNTTAAESTIRDTDFASEIANFTKLQTQLQAGSTVLGNANQLTQLVAGLLRG